MNGVRDTAFRLLATALLVVLTFPRLDVVSDVGVDNSLAWAFNHLFTTGLDQAAHLVFPHGPLAFIMYPQALGGDLGAALMAVGLILGTFLFSLLSLGANTDPERFVWHALLAGALAVVVQVQMQLVGITAVALVLHWRMHGKGWLGLAVLAALIGLHVRAGVGIMACTLLFSHAMLLIWKRKEWRTVIFTTIGFVLAAIVMRWMLYGNLVGLGTYYVGLFELARASSAATGLYPDNNWWALLPAILLFVSIPLLARDTPVRHLFALFALTLFAAWKHGITREDIFHARGLFVFLLFFSGMLLLVWKQPRPFALLTIGTVLVLSYRALAATFLYGDLTIAPFGVNRFAEWVWERPAMTERAIGNSRRNLAQQQLPDSLVQRLKGGTVDVYPWEFSYIPAAQLHWKPRPVLQSYASYTPWLDQRNADFFNTGQGADRILWHFNTDRWGGRMGSIDDRYLLNDEPQAIIAMLDHYTWTEGTDKVAVLERSTADRLGEAGIIGQADAKWDTWIDVPKAADGILRAKVKVSGTLYRGLKDFIYKDALYTVLYRLEDGSTRSYRFVPDLAAEGIWVAPFIQHPESDVVEQAVVAIRFQCSEPAMVKDALPIEWELVRTTQDSGTISAAGLFGKTREEATGRGSGSSLDFETERPEWPWRTATRTDSLAHGGTHASILNAGGYSAPYVLALDSIPGPLLVKGSAWLRAPVDAKVSFVVSVEDDVGSVYWEAVEATDMVFSADDWWRVSIDRNVPVGPGRRLSVYLWNAGTVPVLLDDAAVEWSNAGR
ncbi:MAG TPA: hypothetical protein PLB89_02900 [Flavobacteriales bacterium]|nr:hypothetical protein [Flavobacteriales bacterium]